MTDLVDRIAPKHTRGLHAYQPGKPIEELERELGITGAIKVASNENPLGPSPRALAAIPPALPSLHLYPDAGGWALRRALSSKLGVDPAQIALGAGSNELLYQMVIAFCDPEDEVLSHEFAFLSYKLAALVSGRTFVTTESTPAGGCDANALVAGMNHRTKLVVLGTPNNPTGAVLTRVDAAKILRRLPDRCLLVIDEAYAEYAAAWPEVEHLDGMDLLRRDPRVIVLRTFSKIYGLAGLRVGYGLGDPGVIELLSRVGRTFNVGTLAQVAAIAALEDDEHVQRSAQNARRGVERLRTEVTGPNVHVMPSLGNFVLIDCGVPSNPLYERLLRLGVIVRPMAAWGLPNCLRVSVGTDEQMPRVIAALNEVLAG